MIGTSLFSSCGTQKPSDQLSGQIDTFQYMTDQFADFRVLRYQVPGFEMLALTRKKCFII